MLEPCRYTAGFSAPDLSCERGCLVFNIPDRRVGVKHILKLAAFKEAVCQ